jgi:hypothetical protein
MQVRDQGEGQRAESRRQSCPWSRGILCMQCQLADWLIWQLHVLLMPLWLAGRRKAPTS